MRVCSTNVRAEIWSVPNATNRRIRIKLGAARYALEPDEAIEIARQLVAAVDEESEPKGKIGD